MNKKWFSLIEIIITVSIITLLAVIWISSKSWYDEKVNNSKIVSDTKTINNAFTSYIQENSTLPMPGWNTNFFTKDTTYSHSYEDSETFWVYGSITEKTLPKKYLDNLPLDPRTNSYYSYGKTKITNEFEIASVQLIDASPISTVVWNYKAEHWPYNLIREYNWPSFVYNWSKLNFPYNPNELVLVVTDKKWNVYREWDTIKIAINWDVTKNWSLEIINNEPNWLEIFFSDWSISLLEPNSELTLNKLNFKWKDNLNTLIKLSLWAGKIWTKATKLNEQSQFEVYTQDSAAAVRWTIFWVIKEPTYTETIVIQWIVEVSKLNDIVWTNRILQTLSVNNQKTQTYKSSILTSPTSTTNVLPIFGKLEEIRSDETVENINKLPTIVNEVVETTTCNSSETHMDWLWCVQVDDSLTNSWYSLYAYAPYDIAWDLNLYFNTVPTSTWTYTSDKILNNLTSMPDICTWAWTDINKSFCENQYWNKWILIDNDQYDDYLKYSSLDLGSDFAIEMNVRGSALKRTTWEYYLFNLWGKNLRINYGKLYLGYTYNSIWDIQIVKQMSTSSLSNLTDDSFYKVIAILKWADTINWKLELNNLTTNWPQIFTNSEYNPDLNNIYIWSSSNINKQWNDIIDHIKIYKKLN